MKKLKLALTTLACIFLLSSCNSSKHGSGCLSIKSAANSVVEWLKK